MSLVPHLPNEHVAHGRVHLVAHGHGTWHLLLGSARTELLLPSFLSVYPLDCPNLDVRAPIQCQRATSRTLACRHGTCSASLVLISTQL